LEETIYVLVVVARSLSNATAKRRFNINIIYCIESITLLSIQILNTINGISKIYRTYESKT
jgi:hypothetical protein